MCAIIAARLGQSGRRERGKGKIKMPTMIDVVCACCKLWQRVRDEPGSGTTSRLCGECIEHRGTDHDMQLRRAVDHEAMLRHRCDAARSAATDYEERMKSAFRSRETAVRFLLQLSAVHEDGRNGCTCRTSKDCESARILSHAWVRKMVEKLAVRDYEERQYDPAYWDDDESASTAPYFPAPRSYRSHANLPLGRIGPPYRHGST
jgi:hypothetical protein